MKTRLFLFSIYKMESFKRCFGMKRLLSTLTENETSKKNCDVAVIGGGIIGTSVARKLKLANNNLNVYLIEKEYAVGKHQTSHNSGVMHCGIYYKPGSFKAKFCVEGLELLKQYCADKKICYKTNGKLIVARDQSELAGLEQLFEQGEKNQVKDIKMLNSQCDIQKMTCGCRGVKAIWCPQTGNVNFEEVTQHLFKDFETMGGKTMFNTKIKNIALSGDCEYPLDIIPKEGAPIRAKHAITCGGLQSESLSKFLDNNDSNQQFMSIKIDFLTLKARYCDNLATNVYAVPDLEMPFLGAHFSPLLDDTILVGPFVMPALKTEGYCNDEVNLTYVSRLVASCNFRNMFIRKFCQWVQVANTALCSDTQIKTLQRLFPNLSYQFIEKGPQAVQSLLLRPDGKFVDDFVFDIFSSRGIGQRILNVKFTPSPAATGCLAIANYVVDEFNKVTQC